MGFLILNQPEAFRREFPELEPELWEKIQDFRSDFEQGDYAQHLAGQRISEYQLGLGVAVSIAQNIYQILLEKRIFANHSDPGHGAGHWLRDFGANGLQLIMALQKSGGIHPGELAVGFLAACFHDLGCAIIPRYREGAVAHAEVGALLMMEILEENNFFVLSEVDWKSLVYAIAAHTHYTSDQEKKGIDGLTRIRRPYLDTTQLGGQIRPIWPVCLARQVDRLDVNGPCFPGRHFLTLAETHQDYAQDGFFLAEFVKQMEPFFADEAGHKTMLSHLKMFCDSQQVENVYTRFDLPPMQAIRDRYARFLGRIIQTVHEEPNPLIANQDEAVLKAWQIFLTTNIEPTEAGLIAADTVLARFTDLDKQTRRHWVCGFFQTMVEYQKWAKEVLLFLDAVKRDWLYLPGVTKSIPDSVRPNQGWVDILAEITG